MANKKKLSKKLIKNIVSLIESGETSISKICSLTGISRSAWYKWEAGENTQFAVRLSRARTRRKAIEDEKMVCESKRSLLLLLQGYCTVKTETKTEFLDEGGETITTTITTKHIPPCTKTIIFFLKNMDSSNFKSTLKRHVNAKIGYINKASGKNGARILTMAEAYAIGTIDRPP